TETIRYRVSVSTSVLPGTYLRNDVRVEDGSGDIDENASATVAVIGTLPQTGTNGTNGLSASLRPLTGKSSSPATLPFALFLTIMGLGAGTGMGLGKRFMF